jgi:hypothetical protein
MFCAMLRMADPRSTSVLSLLRFSKVKSNSAPDDVRITGIARRFDGGMTWPHESVVIFDGSR